MYFNDNEKHDHPHGILKTTKNKVMILTRPDFWGRASLTAIGLPFGTSGSRSSWGCNDVHVNDLHLLVYVLVGLLPLGQTARRKACRRTHEIVLQDVEDL